VRLRTRIAQAMTAANRPLNDTHVTVAIQNDDVHGGSHLDQYSPLVPHLRFKH